MDDQRYLTLAEVRATVKAIKKLPWESAHALEDALYVRVLRAIAEGGLSEGHGAALAEEALKTRNFNFARWRG